MFITPHTNVHLPRNPPYCVSKSFRLSFNHQKAITHVKNPFPPGPYYGKCIFVYTSGWVELSFLLTSAEVGEYMHPCEGDLICKSSSEKVPYFNAPIYLENKSQVGKIDEIFGQVSSHVSCTYMWSIKRREWCSLGLAFS